VSFRPCDLCLTKYEKWGQPPYCNFRTGYLEKYSTQNFVNNLDLFKIIFFLSSEKDFSSILCVQTGSGAHPASCTMGTGGPIPGGKPRPGRDTVHLSPSNAEIKNEQELYLLSPIRTHGV
jgi:hypothetical protein